LEAANRNLFNDNSLAEQERGKQMRIASVKPNDLAVKDGTFVLIADSLAEQGLLPKGASMIDFIARYDSFRNSLEGAIAKGQTVALDSNLLKSLVPLDAPLFEHLEGLGFRRAVISKARYTKLKEDVPTLDFSGFPVYTHVNVPDTIFTSICSAIEARREKIPWQEEGPLPLDRMCRDTPEGPLNIPLHPAAEGFWRERGYLS
jgi:hypothetical protein